MTNSLSNELAPVNLRESLELIHDIDPIARKLESEYWVSPLHVELEKQGFDVGQSLFFGRAIKAFQDKSLTDPEATKARQEYREAVQEEAPSTDKRLQLPLVELPLSVMEQATPEDALMEMRHIFLTKEQIDVAKGLCVTYGMSLSPMLRVVAIDFIEDKAQN